MKSMKLALIPFVVASAQTNPVQKVLQLLGDLHGKITAEGEEAEKVYVEFAAICEDRSKDLGFEIKTGKSAAADLTASIAKSSSVIESRSTKLEELAASIATDEADLKAATEIRSKEKSDFLTAEKDLRETIDMLERAISILDKEMNGGASMLQLQNAGSVTKALEILVEASSISSSEGAKLTAFVQSAQQSEDEEEGVGAPDAAVYESHSGNIVQTLETLLEKAQTSLDEARKTEVSAIHNFQMLEQSLQDEVRFANKEMDEAKKEAAQAGEAKATAEGELIATNEELAADTTALEDLHHDCMTRAQDHEAATQSRQEELTALAKAKDVISEMTGNAEKFQYGLTQTSLMQVKSGSEMPNFAAARFLRDLARKQHSSALALLASRVASTVRSSSVHGQDPFSKVKGLIADMIEKLEADADSDASHKAYCDKETAETNAKKEDKSSEIDKLSTKIDGMTSRSAQLKEEVAALQKSLSELTRTQAEMDKLRQEEKTDYTQNKADLEQGLEGVRLALKVLREYYAQEDKAHSAADGAGSNIIGLIEVIEADLSKSLAGINSEEETAQSSYEAETKENQIENAAKTKDVEYKVKESTGLDKSVAEAAADRSGVQAELDAISEYSAGLAKQCVAKPETYEERKGRREAELAGLKQALSILEGEAVLLQKTTRRSLRGPAH